MTDMKMLELAAKATGYEVEAFCPNGSLVCNDALRPYGFTWNPLTDDGDALRLAVKLRIDIDNMTDACYCEGPYGQEAFVEIENDDPYAATRRTIVRAAAEIGKSHG